MRTRMFAFALGVLAFVVPTEALSAPSDPVVGRESEPSSESERDTARFLLFGGFGAPDLLFIEADHAVWRGLLVTARAGGLLPLFARFSTGVLGFLPLSSDTSLVPRHALGLQAEFSMVAMLNLNEEFESGLDHGRFRSTIGPTVSAGYLYTPKDGRHLRLMGGAFLPVSGDLAWPTVSLLLGIGMIR